MKNFLAIIGIIFLIVAVAAVGVLGYYSKGFKDWSFLQLDQLLPDSTTPGGNTDPGGSTTPGDGHEHTYQWMEKQQSLQGIPYREAYNNIPKGFEDYYILDELDFTESSEQFVFYIGHMKSDTTAYFLSPDAVVLASCKLENKDADDFYEINVPLSDSLRLIGLKSKGYASGIYLMADIKYSACICTECGELKNSSGGSTAPGESTTPGDETEEQWEVMTYRTSYEWIDELLQDYAQGFIFSPPSEDERTDVLCAVLSKEDDETSKWYFATFSQGDLAVKKILYYSETGYESVDFKWTANIRILGIHREPPEDMSSGEERYCTITYAVKKA